jgi:hypothetical protein
MRIDKLHAKGKRGGTFLIIGKLHEEKNRVPYIGCWVKNNNTISSILRLGSLSKPRHN